MSKMPYFLGTSLFAGVSSLLIVTIFEPIFKNENGLGTVTLGKA